MATCKECIHYVPCADWAKDCFGDESLFPYECDESELLCENYMPTADVAPIADTVRAFADRLITYYKSLNGTTSPVLTAYHVEQILKEFLKEKENT